MARSHLTLAALATSAVPGLDVVAAAGFGTGAHNDFDSALLTGRDGRHWIARLPRNERAEAEQSADLVALRALSEGVRSRLPFGVSSFAGQTPAGDTRAIVYEFVYGSKVPLTNLDVGLAESAGRAIGAIHALPTSFVADAGLPVLTPIECLHSCISIMDRGAATGLVPAALLSRWEAATDDPSLWQFQSTVINGALTADSLLSADGRVTGILGWHDLRVGDPARDLFWMLGCPDAEVVAAGFDAYSAMRGSGDRNLRQRATLYAELELARWLLHGTDTRSTETVDDAVDLLHGLLDSVENDLMNPIRPHTLPTLAVGEVEDMLDWTERAV